MALDSTARALALKAIQEGSEGISYIVEAPISDNTDGDLKFVILEQDPPTKYEGYIYIITG